MIVSEQEVLKDSLANKDESGKFREYFDENGYLPPFTLYERESANELWALTRLKLLNKKNAIYPQNVMNYDRHLDIKTISDIVTHPEIIRRVQSVLGPNILCWRTEWFPKYPGDEGTAWHQAQSFVAFEGGSKLVPTEVHDGSWEVTVWFAFTDAKKETGCLKVIPKTHRTWYFDEHRNINYDPDSINQGKGSGFYGYDFDKLKIDPDWSPDESEAVHFEMQAGQAFMFTSRCLHGAEGNTTRDETRMGMAIRYVPTDVRVYPNHDTHYTHFGEVFPLDNYKSMLVAGEDSYHHNKITLPL